MSGWVLVLVLYLCSAGSAGRRSGQKPGLLRDLRSQYSIDPEQTTHFSPCQVYGYPTPTVIWSREGEMLPDSPTLGLYYTSDGVLVLTHAVPADSGYFTCTATNARGNLSASTNITIESPTIGNSSYRQWWMLFIYMWIAWLLLSTGVIVRVIRHWRSAVKDFSGAAVEDVNGAYVAENEHALEQLHPVTAPPEWQPQTDNLQLFVIEQDSAEWDKVEQYFKNTLPNADIQEICRIQNKWLWRRFINHKEQLCQKNQGISEKELFHGTRGNDPKLIYDSEVAFDMRFSAKGMWGQANYFAVNASYSDGYAFHKGNGLKEMFLVKVLIGETYECQPDSSLRLPPEKETIEMGPMKFSKTRYDTVTGTTGGSRVYMTYDNEKAYPAYLIKYKCS